MSKTKLLCEKECSKRREELSTEVRESFLDRYLMLEFNLKELISMFSK